MNITRTHENIHIRGMGNLLDTDSSNSEVEGDSEADLVFHKNAVRTDGDGMESVEKQTAAGQIPPGSSERMGSSQNFAQGLKETTAFEIDELATGLDPLKNKFQSPTDRSIRKSKGQVESPKELPPKSQLISINPVRIAEKPVETVETLNSSAKLQFNNSAVLQQKNPKFVPYEPYKGAVRSMTEETIRTHSRKESGGSSASGVSTSAPHCISPSPSRAQLAGNAQTSPFHDSPTQHQHLDNTKSDNITNRANKNTNHSELLLRERVKLQLKDISDLQSENARLKKLLVDSMSGSRQVLQTHEMGLDPFSLDAPGNSSISESFDNLSDEIEVWRSKFLSSCILVEQLNVENRILKENEVSATQLFKNIKENATLTPALFEQINLWLHRRPSFRSEFHTGTNNNNDNDNEI